MKLDDGFNSLDKGFRFKISVIELMIRYELNDTDGVEYLIGQIEKEFEDLINDENYGRQVALIDIIRRMIFVNQITRDEELMKDINKLLTAVTDEEAADVDVISYNNWLRSKIK